MSQFKTEQENFWAGEFGNEYITRNSGTKILQRKLYTWKKVTSNINNLNSCIEFGSNVGYNLIALERLFPSLSLSRVAVEINKKACAELNKIQGVEVLNSSILDYTPIKTYDLSFTCGVLIHINPNELKQVYEKLYKSSHKYIFIQEYYSLQPVEINYRGHSGRLFKRDFADEILKQYSDLKLVNYGFFYHNDENINEDTNWFLFQKNI